MCVMFSTKINFLNIRIRPTSFSNECLYVYHTAVVKTQVMWIKDMNKGANQGSLSANNFYSRNRVLRFGARKQVHRL